MKILHDENLRQRLSETVPFIVQSLQAASEQEAVPFTQRQTIVLVDWDGNITYKERALWDSHGNAIERGKGDETFKFEIEE